MILFMNVHIKEAHRKRTSPISNYANAELNSKFVENTDLCCFCTTVENNKRRPGNAANQPSNGPHDQTHRGDLLYEVRFTSKANISSKVNIVSTQKLDVGFVPSKSPSKEPKLAATHRCGFLCLRNMSNVSEDGSISIRHLPESLSWICFLCKYYCDSADDTAGTS